MDFAFGGKRVTRRHGTTLRCRAASRRPIDRVTNKSNWNSDEKNTRRYTIIFRRKVKYAQRTFSINEQTDGATEKAGEAVLDRWNSSNFPFVRFALSISDKN